MAAVLQTCHKLSKQEVLLSAIKCYTCLELRVEPSSVCLFDPQSLGGGGRYYTFVCFVM